MFANLILRPRYEFEKVLYGDKDCFRLAWFAHRRNFSFAEFPAQIGTGKFQRAYLLHYWNGHPAFVHQYKSVAHNLDKLVMQRTLGTSLTASPPCYDGCLPEPSSSDVTPLDGQTKSALEMWNEIKLR